MWEIEIRTGRARDGETRGDSERRRNGEAEGRKCMKVKICRSVEGIEREVDKEEREIEKRERKERRERERKRERERDR